MKAEEVVAKLQEKLINAKEGDVIEIPEGTFEFKAPLSIDKINKLTIKGQGMEKTIITFKGQTEGAEGFKVSACNDITFEGMSLLDAKGDILKIQECKGVNIIKIKTGWTGGPDSMNGSYALYPVTCERVLIDGCEVFCASDAGIYVGQSKDIIVRNNYVHENVAGIEIENSSNAEVYKNRAENNTGGICVFDLPDIPVKMGQNIRIYDNDVKNNNLPNFAPVGNSVALVPAGTGSFVLSSHNVEFFNNRFENHRTVGTGVISYLILEKPLKDSLYDPFYTGIYIHDNSYINTGSAPDTTRIMGLLLASLFQGKGMEIVIDGIVNPFFADMNTGRMKGDAAVCIKNNKDAKFVNLDAGNNFKNMDMDVTHYDCALNAIKTSADWLGKK